MASSFTAEDISKLREVRRLLNEKIIWRGDPGGEEASDAYHALGRFLESPAVQPKKFCVSCGQELKK